MHDLRTLLASATGRRLLAALAVLVLGAQFLAAGHLHLDGHADDRSHLHHCDLCVAQDRLGPAPAAVPPALPAARRAEPLPALAPAARPAERSSPYAARGPPAILQS